MKQKTKTVAREQKNDFSSAAEKPRRSFAGEFWDFARNNKKWWMIPIIVIVLAVGLLVLAGGSGAGPLIYPLF